LAVARKASTNQLVHTITPNLEAVQARGIHFSNDYSDRIINVAYKQCIALPIALKHVKLAIITSCLELFTCALESKPVPWKSVSPSLNTFAAIAQRDAVFKFNDGFEAVRQKLNGKIFTDWAHQEGDGDAMGGVSTQPRQPSLCNGEDARYE
jgi:hypothetical protein